MKADWKHKMTLHLYHGRKTKDEEMDDWGSEGPVLEVDGVTVTYGSDIRIMFTGQGDYEFLSTYCIEDLFYYDGVYYGDWSVQPLDKDTKNMVKVFDPKLGKEGMNETV